MSYTRHQMPFIGQLPDGIWSAIGFGGHGVAPTTLGGEVLARAMAGIEPVPAAFGHYGLEPTHGRLGLAAAQGTYWMLQARDALASWWHDRAA